MNRSEKIDLMLQRFVHPNSGYAQQFFYPRKVGNISAGTHFFRQFDGACTHDPKHIRPLECSDRTPAVFTKERMAEHLKGEKTYAPYQLDAEGNVKWLCLDVDASKDASEEDVRRIVKDVARAVFQRFGEGRFLVEASGSKGYHVWVFFDRPVPTQNAHALGHRLIERVGPAPNIVVEVYPKQQSNSPFGNTVKLPLGVHQKTKSRCLFVNANFEPHADQWQRLQHVVPVSAEDVLTIAPLLPERSETAEDMRYTPKCLAEAMHVGVKEGVRDVAAFKIACYLRDKGIPRAYAEPMMEQWNANLSMPLDDYDLRIKIEQGYNPKGYSWSPCGMAEFDHMCQSSCPFWKRKVERRWGKRTDNPVGIISRE